MSASQQPTEKGPGTVADTAFDRWLRGELTRLYDDALSEPVPDELLRLLDGKPAPGSKPRR